MLSAGFEIDARSYKPHITLARLTSTKTSARVGSIVTGNANAVRAKFQVHEVVLFESLAGEKTRKYLPLHTFSLGAP